MIKIENISEMLKGILQGIILQIISEDEVYGYEIVKRLNSMGFSEIAEGTVYTVLVRLERNKMVNITKKPSQLGPPRKFYSLNEKGIIELESFWTRWNFLESRINALKK